MGFEDLCLLLGHGSRLRLRAGERNRHRLSFTPASPSFLVATSLDEHRGKMAQGFSVLGFALNGILGQTKGCLVVAVGCCNVP